MVLIHGGNAASAPHLLLPSIVPASPSRTAPARERKKWSPIGSPLSTSAEDPSSSGTGLHQWMEELSGPSGPIGMQIPRAQLPFRSSARSHRPLTCDPPHRCTSPDPDPDPSPSPSPSPAVGLACQPFSAISPQYLRCISAASPLHLRCISAASPRTSQACQRFSAQYVRQRGLTLTPQVISP